MKIFANEAIQVRATTESDGSAVWRLIKEAGTLDLNSSYCYIMLCDIFKETCAVACRSTEIIGFMSAYRRPDKSDTLFVWQVAVNEHARGRGIAKAMLQELLDRKENKHIRFVEATVGPDNIPSGKLFTGLAGEHGTECKVVEHYGQNLFPEGMNHEPELLYRIGPLRDRR
ncbi:diaminobutyrate acetyltransferase [Paenibacillus alkaliterrae]|uniref:diaminobutyrate acetyltransferase n=1 Tax=Paenibacillus alkaliterrae TaxID=320909 RepID=UPI001F25A03C|nr:diaminobutyrate acetyltransferase [Paenibacillus alkaliterrae]MCF2938227.1 diaminobutyrate acetyltransferase [Paenibacillus alkaliterrae]